jgi:hypothetical protein
VYQKCYQPCRQGNVSKYFSDVAFLVLENLLNLNEKGKRFVFSCILDVRDGSND